MKGRAACWLLFLIVLGESISFGRASDVLEHRTAATLPEESGSNHNGTCHYQSKFVNSERTVQNARVELLRNPTVADFGRDLTGYALFFSEIPDSVNIASTFNSNLTVLFGDVAFWDPSTKIDKQGSELVGGVKYGQYSLYAGEEYLEIYYHGKSKYSHEDIAFLSCLFPSTWQGSDGLPPHGTVFDIAVQLSEFERHVFNSFLYRFCFQYVAGGLFLAVAFECLFGLHQYRTYCRTEEVRALFASPVSCLVINMATSGLMSFIFFLDGWGSTGFLTVETFSAFATLTRMTTMASVLMMTLRKYKIQQVLRPLVSLVVTIPPP